MQFTMPGACNSHSISTVGCAQGSHSGASAGPMDDLGLLDELDGAGIVCVALETYADRSDMR